MKRTLCTLAVSMFVIIAVLIGRLGAECTTDAVQAGNTSFALAALLSPGTMAVASLPMMLIGWFGTRRRI